MWQPEQPSSHTVASRFLLIDPTGAKAQSFHPTYAALKGRSSTLIRFPLFHTHSFPTLPHSFIFPRFHLQSFSHDSTLVRFAAIPNLIRFLPASWSGRAGTGAA